MPDSYFQRVLVADANQASRKNLARLLLDIGFSKVVFATDASGTYAALTKGSVDVAVVSWDIASASNFSLIKKVHNDSGRPNLPFVAIASGMSQDKIMIAEHAGINSVLPNPPAVRELGAAMEQALSDGSQAPRSKPKAKAARSAGGGAANGALGQGKTASGGPAVGNKVPEASPPPPSAPPEQKLKAKKLIAAGIKKLKGKDAEGALQYFGKAAKLDGESPEAFKGIAHALKGKGDMKRARQFMHKAAENYVYQGKNMEAESIYIDLLKANPNASNPLQTAGEKMRQRGETERALDVLHKAHEMSPKDARTASSLSNAYRDIGDDDKALEFLKTVLELDVDFPGATETYLSITGEDFYSAEGHMDEMQILDQDVEKKGVEKRGAPRMAMADYSVHLLKKDEPLPVVDISVTGVGFKPVGEKFQHGEIIHFDLVAYGTPKIKKLTAKVMRVSTRVIGCQFVDLTKKQSKTLYKITGTK